MLTSLFCKVCLLLTCLCVLGYGFAQRTSASNSLTVAIVDGEFRPSTARLRPGDFLYIKNYDPIHHYIVAGGFTIRIDSKETKGMMYADPYFLQFYVQENPDSILRAYWGEATYLPDVGVQSSAPPPSLTPTPTTRPINCALQGSPDLDYPLEIVSVDVINNEVYLRNNSPEILHLDNFTLCSVFVGQRVLLPARDVLAHETIVFDTSDVWGENRRNQAVLYDQYGRFISTR